ncbi:Clavaminate synthase protein [Salix suchowensis]|nr:Clavaminate synthase protein [Salix suchowensis]
MQPTTGCSETLGAMVISLLYTPGDSVNLHALVEESPVIADYVAKHPEGFHETGATSLEWFTRRIKNQRISNRKVSDRFLVSALRTVRSDTCTQRDLKPGRQVEGRKYEFNLGARILTGHFKQRGLGARLEGVGQAALSTVLTVVVESHLKTNIRRDKRVSSSLTKMPAPTQRGALAAEALDLAIRVDLVVLQDGHLDFLALVLDLLGVCITNGSAHDLEQSKRLRTFLDIVDSVRGLYFESDGFAREAGITVSSTERLQDQDKLTSLQKSAFVRTLSSVQRIQRWSLRKKQEPGS